MIPDQLGRKRLTPARLIKQKQTGLENRHPQLRQQLARPSAPPIRYQPGSIVLGRNHLGCAVILEPKTRLEHHHIIGATGSGKSTLIQHCARQDILAGHGVCVLDPHGNHPDSLYRNLLVWLHKSGVAKHRTIHLIDPNATSHCVGFNPLDRADPELQFSVIADAMFEAFERVWGDEDGNAKPTIQRVLTATFTALGERRLTLAEARLLFDPDDRHGIRAMVLDKLEDAYAYEEIDYLHRIGQERTGRRDFRAEVIGPINRVAKLVRTEAVRAIVGQTDNVLDLRDVMDRGDIILGNLSGGSQMYEQAGDLLGRLLTRFFFFHSRRRKHPDRPYFLYLDECQRYLSGDVPNMLAESRKQGLGIVAGHQWLAQTGRRDDPIREALSKGPNIKTVFRIKDPSEAAELAEAVTQLDLERPVRALIKPTIVGHKRTLFRGKGTGSQHSRTFTTGESVTASVATSRGTNSAVTHSEGTSDSVTHSQSTTETHGTSHTVGVTDGYSDSISESDSTSASYGESSSDSYGSSLGQDTNRSDSYDPQNDLLLINPTATTLRQGRSSGSNQSHADGSGWQESSSQTIGSTHTTSHSESESDTESQSLGTTEGVATTHGSSRGTAQTTGRSESKTLGYAVGETRTSGTTTGTSDSESVTEGIEPIYADLPTAVHGKDNMLYYAARELMSLPTGVARIAYVGAHGRYESALHVPNILTPRLSDDDFQKLRFETFEASSAARSMNEATQNLATRELLLKQQADIQSEADEPNDASGFRVPVLKRQKR